MSLTLKSTAFSEGERIPREHTCDGNNTSPPLAWSGRPDGTRSFVLLCDDPDAPTGTFHHWGLYDVPPEVDRIDAGCPVHARLGAARQASNDFGRAGYGGPCPPKGHGDHRYRFKLLALDADRLDVPDGAGIPDVAQAAEPHVLDRTELVGLYGR
jgi:hypothetical protein